MPPAVHCHKIITVPTCTQGVLLHLLPLEFDGVMPVPVALDDHACIGYNIATVQSVLSAHRV